MAYVLDTQSVDESDNEAEAQVLRHKIFEQTVSNTLADAKVVPKNVRYQLEVSKVQEKAHRDLSEADRLPL